MTSRGQTTYDYLLGTVLLLVTIIAVLSVLPQLFDPFTSPVSAEERGLADRIATEAIETNATANSERTLNVSGIQDEEQYISDLKNRSGIWKPYARSVNITFQKPGTLSPGKTIGEERLDSTPEAQAVRNVRTVDSSTCNGECHMIVRVW